jgi:thiol:disulfide interchange protein DsbD
MPPVTRTFTSALGLVVVIAAPAAPAAQRSTHAKVELITELDRVAPGQDVTLGLRFSLDPGWHIYWRNPGESGGPPSVKWDAPAALTINPIQWPVPERVVVPGDTSYGYRQSVMLLVPSSVTSAAMAGTRLPVKGAVDYQICNDICVKESAAVSTTIDVAPATEPRDMPDFARARASLPQAMPAAWHASTNVETDELVISIDTGQPETSASFLPYQSGLIDDSARQRVETDSSGVTIHLQKSLFFSKPPTSLEGLVLLSAGAFEILAPVRD